MTSKQKDILSEIEKKALYIDWNVAFGGKSKGNKHLSRVVKIAKKLQEIEGGDRFTVIAAAWMHDIALGAGDDTNAHNIESLAEESLLAFDISNEEKSKIKEAIVWHEDPNGSMSLEAKIVHDADVIDKGGILGIIRHTWKMTNLLENRILNSDEDFEKLALHLKRRKSKVFTETASHILIILDSSLTYFLNNREKGREIMSKISRLAHQGVISDKIADEILPLLDEQNKKLLADQLNCNYLNSL